MSLIAKPKGRFFGNEQCAPLAWCEAPPSRLFAPIAGNYDGASHVDTQLALGGEALQDAFRPAVDALSALRIST